MSDGVAPGAPLDASGGRTALDRVTPLGAPIAALLGSGLCLLLLGRRSFDLGEAHAVELASGSWGALWESLRAGEMPAAASDSLLKLWLGLVGNGAGDALVRLPSALLVGLSGGVVALAAWRLFGRLGGLAAGLLLTTSAAGVAWGQHAGGAALTLLTCSCAVAAVCRALARDGRIAWVVASVALSIAVLADVTSVALVLATGVAVTGRPAAAPPLRQGLAVGAPLVVAAASLALLVAADAASTSARSLSQVGHASWDAVGGNPVLVLAAAAGGAALSTGHAWTRASAATPFLVGAAGGPFVALLLASVVRPAFDARHLAAALPALVMLAAACVVAFRRTGSIVAAVLLLVAGGQLARHFTSTPAADWKGAARSVVTRQQAGESIVVEPPSSRTAFDRYAGRGLAVPRVEGEAVWLVLAGEGTTPLERIERGRRIVGAPRYALVEETLHGSRLAVQLWRRP